MPPASVTATTGSGAASATSRCSATGRTFAPAAASSSPSVVAVSSVGMSVLAVRISSV